VKLWVIFRLFCGGVGLLILLVLSFPFYLILSCSNLENPQIYKHFSHGSSVLSCPERVSNRTLSPARFSLGPIWTFFLA
jgi:hypothetical protein